MLRLMPAALLFLVPAPLAAAAHGPAVQKAGQCTIDALPEPQKRRLIDGYVSRHKSEGKASADAWAKAQEAAIYRQLVAQGACPANRTMTRTAQPPARPAGKKAMLNKQGKPCRRIEVENQIFPGFGGEPMRMALVQVCKD